MAETGDLGQMYGVDAMRHRAARIKAVGDLQKYGNQNAAAANKAAEDFEAMFVSQMLTHMFDGIEPDENTGGGKSEEIYRSMLVDEYGKIIARSGGIGIAAHVKRELLKLQEVQ